MTITSSPLHDIQGLASQMVGHFTDNVAVCRTLPGEELHGEVTMVTRSCLALAIDILDQRTAPTEEQLAAVTTSAAQWAREGVPLETILRAYSEGFQIGLTLVGDQASAGDVGELIAGTRLIFQLLESITIAVSSAYVDEQRLVAREHQTAAQTMVSALLSGHSAAALARQTGIAIAASYQVVAMSIPPHPDEQNPRVNTQIAARRKLRRLQAALADLFAGRSLSLLSTEGGTLLVPTDTDDAPMLTDAVLAKLSAAAEVPLTATVVAGDTGEVPAISDRAHELLDLVRAIGKQPGLYQMADVAIEYQITRPGPAMDQLTAVLDPLDGHPELLETLRAHLSTGLNRKATGHRMHIHPNTVDYRMRRIAQLAAIDLTRPEGISRANIALLARDLREK